MKEEGKGEGRERRGRRKGSREGEGDGSGRRRKRGKACKREKQTHSNNIRLILEFQGDFAEEQPQNLDFYQKREFASMHLYFPRGFHPLPPLLFDQK